MARPTKIGLDYFPLDVHLSDEVESVESVHGNEGFSVIIKAWQALYQTSDGRIDCSGVLRRKTLAKRANITEERWIEVIDTCVEAGLFDKDEWISRRVLTSNGVKKRMEQVLREREEGRKRAELRWKKSYLPKNDAKNDAQNDGIEIESESESESERVEKSRGTASVPNPGFSDYFIKEVWPYFAKNKKGPYRSIESQRVAILQLYEKCHGNEDVAIQALRETISNNYQGFTWYFDRKGGNNGRDGKKRGSSPEEWAAAYESL